MATKEFILRPGEELPGNIETAFVHLLGSELTAKAQQEGGKFKVVLTTPWPKAPKIKREKKIIDQEFVNRLKALAGDEARLENEIEQLRGPEILKVATLLDVPMSKSSKLSSLRAQLHKTLRSEIVWNSIAGHQKPTLESERLVPARVFEESEKTPRTQLENPSEGE